MKSKAIGQSNHLSDVFENFTPVDHARFIWTTFILYSLSRNDIKISDNLENMVHFLLFSEFNKQKFLIFFSKKMELMFDPKDVLSVQCPPTNFCVSTDVSNSVRKKALRIGDIEPSQS